MIATLASAMLLATPGAELGEAMQAEVAAFHPCRSQWPMEAMRTMESRGRRVCRIWLRRQHPSSAPIQREYSWPHSSILDPSLLTGHRPGRVSPG